MNVFDIIIQKIIENFHVWWYSILTMRKKDINRTTISPTV